jgi:hypothetical protein
MRAVCSAGANRCELQALLVARWTEPWLLVNNNNNNSYRRSVPKQRDRRRRRQQIGSRASNKTEECISLKGKHEHAKESQSRQIKKKHKKHGEKCSVEDRNYMFISKR